MALYVDRQLCPEERLKLLLSNCGKVVIDPKISAKLYFNSGLNMFQQFNLYYNDQAWENAFYLFLKYEILFFDKIKKHPEYSKIPVNIKSVIASNFRLIKPKGEHAKLELFKQFRMDYIVYVEELRIKKNLTSDSNEDSTTSEESKRDLSRRSTGSTVSAPTSQTNGMLKRRK
ncbi:unnamed protein product [Ceutorhynchus assimilis]|uniref:USP8 dimerisation domain-containing protein n=1 Tax=Ceutorhynchus assimilis TaxID=467358 RepID=A0A9N9MKP6_9CUCU|nr:unnamed protein product [Ceutorhynchus assimilis]